MGKVEDNKKKKQTTLLKTAFELFTSKGINKTSISDIVSKAGVAKGTFYLYFSDKYDIRDKLIAHKSSELFQHAYRELSKSALTEFEDRVIFLVDHIINELSKNRILLDFISKNLTWRIFKHALTSPGAEKEDINFMEFYNDRILGAEGPSFTDPEVMLFLIIELVGSTCKSAILYEDPINMEELKPHLYNMIRMIIKTYRKDSKGDSAASELSPAASSDCSSSSSIS